MVVAKLSPMGSAMGDSNWNLFFYKVSQCHFLCLYSESIILLLFFSGRENCMQRTERKVYYTKFCLFQIKKMPSRIHSSREGDSF